MSEAIEQAKTVLLNFMKEMNVWEVKFCQLYSEDMSKYVDMALDEVREIYAKWVTQRERKYGRLGGAPSVGTPPEYDPKTESIEKIEETGKNKLTIYTNSIEPGDYIVKYRYTLKFNNNEWRIDKKERYSSIKENWVKHLM